MSSINYLYDMRDAAAQNENPMRTFVKRMLEAASKANVDRYDSIRRDCSGLSVHFIIEGVHADEFDMVVTSTRIELIDASCIPTEGVTLRISPEVFLSLIQGQQTPTEAFMSGMFRACGPSKDLFKLHDLFSALAELTFLTKEMRAIVVDFEESQSASQCG